MTALVPASSPQLHRSTPSTTFTQCAHTLTQCRDSVIALVMAPTRGYLFAGTERGDLHAWDMATMQLRQTVRGHRGHILAAIVTNDGRLLMTAGGENAIRVWDLEALPALRCVAVIHAGTDCGDIYSIVYCEALSTIYVACKDGSIQWFDWKARHDIATVQGKSQFACRDFRFFPDEHTADESVRIAAEEDTNGADDTTIDSFVILESNVQKLSHNGFVYAILVANVDASSPIFGNERAPVLISGAGDGTIKLWNIAGRTPLHLHTIRASNGSVLALHLQDGLLYSGAQGGQIKIWDMETLQCIRTLMEHTDDVLTLCGSKSVVFSGSSDGTIKKWNRRFDCAQTIKEHKSIVLTLAMSRNLLASGAGDHLIKLWDIPQIENALVEETQPNRDPMVDALDKFVAIATMSSDSTKREECRQGAHFLKGLFKKFGADTKIIAGCEGKNALVVAAFRASSGANSGALKPISVLFYGHYDVQPADITRWDTPPFEMKGRDGFLYGRGVSDNKGPILAMLFAVNELIEARQLHANVYFLIEGEEESGSAGLYDAVERNKDFFGDIDVILISNSYWINDRQPCLTYGLRGVVHATIEVSGAPQDLHSGVDGGAYDEPLDNLLKVLGRLSSDSKQVLVPGFADCVRPVDKDEMAAYELLTSRLQKYKGAEVTDRMALLRNLMARWRFPTLSIHKVDVSGPASNTVIPRNATATVSMRIVPDQDLDSVCTAFEQYVSDLFLALESSNRLKISIGHRADWWLANVSRCSLYAAAAEAIREEWGTEPLLIREGGSIPAVPYLEKTFGACAVHVPMGQASDSAHLPNERIRLENLMRGKSVMKRLLGKIVGHRRSSTSVVSTGNAGPSANAS